VRHHHETGNPPQPVQIGAADRRYLRAARQQQAFPIRPPLDPKEPPMRRQSFPALAVLGAAVLAFSLSHFAKAATENRISGPYTHENLSIYFVHGASAGGAVPLTLAEALGKDRVRVIETGDVNRIEIENLGEEEVFVQSGDIVKGGKQDRVLSVSLILPPRSGRIPIASFCVEQGRWSARGREDVGKFSSAAAAMPSREAKIAMSAPEPAQGAGAANSFLPGDTGSRQQRVWRSVSSSQDRLSGSIGAPVASRVSGSSLQLSLENEKLREAQKKYIESLTAAGENDQDIVGYVVAVNGKLSSADIYPSNGLFRKMWPKQLAAGATEAIGERNAKSDAPPSIEAVAAFLAAAEEGKATQRELPANISLQTLDSPNALVIETARKEGAFVHRSYLAK
jgi:hypothetical protein